MEEGTYMIKSYQLNEFHGNAIVWKWKGWIKPALDFWGISARPEVPFSAVMGGVECLLMIEWIESGGVHKWWYQKMDGLEEGKSQSKNGWWLGVHMMTGGTPNV